MKMYALIETDELYNDTIIVKYFDNYLEAQEKADELNAKSYKYDFHYSIVPVQVELESRWK